MPEMTFRIRWPNGEEESCYSPSLVIKEFFEPGAAYAIEDFLTRSRVALRIASDRVKARYGRPCGLTLGQLQRIEITATGFAAMPGAEVWVLGFQDG